MLELYHWEPNAESLALLICLKETDLEFTGHYVDLLKLANHTDDYLAMSVKGRVPMLVADGEYMDDTGLALQYLAEKFPQPAMVPDNAADRYDLQAWLAWLGGEQGFAADVRLLGWNLVMLKTIPENQLQEFRDKAAALPRELHSGWSAVWSDAEANEDMLTNARERVSGLLDKADTTLAATGWLAGINYSIADMLAYAHIHTLPGLLPELVNRDKTPNVIRWLETITERPAVQQAMQMKKTSIAGDVYSAPGT